MVTFVLSAPVNVGTLTAPVLVSSLVITAASFSSTPPLAAIGTGQLSVTMTDTGNGWQETVQYSDSGVLELWAQPQNAAPGTALGDIISTVIFTKLVQDGKLPAGTISQE